MDFPPVNSGHFGQELLEEHEKHIVRPGAPSSVLAPSSILSFLGGLFLIWFILCHLVFEAAHLQKTQVEKMADHKEPNTRRIGVQPFGEALFWHTPYLLTLRLPPRASTEASEEAGGVLKQAQISMWFRP